jgi:hypothetical protein
MQELSKADKRICRELIHTALERECKAYVEKMARISSKQVDHEGPYQEENGFPVEGPWHKQFIKLFKATDSFNYRLARIYDGMSGSRYLPTVRILYEDGWLTDEEVSRIEAIGFKSFA